MALWGFAFFNLPNFFATKHSTAFNSLLDGGDIFSCNITQYSIYPFSFGFNCFLSTFLKLGGPSSVFIWSVASLINLISSYLTSRSCRPLSKFAVFVSSTSTFSCDRFLSYVFYSSILGSSMFSLSYVFLWISSCSTSGSLAFVLSAHLMC